MGEFSLTWHWIPAGMSTSVAAAFLVSHTLGVIPAFFNTYSCCARLDHGTHSLFHCKRRKTTFYQIWHIPNIAVGNPDKTPS